MTWTYDTALTAAKDQVRFYSGDTDSAAQLVQDEEIAFAISQEANVVTAAALVCEHLASKFSARASKTVGPLRIELGERARNYQAKADHLRRLAARSAAPTLGGLLVAQVKASEADATLVQPSFKTGMLDRPDVPRVADETGGGS